MIWFQSMFAAGSSSCTLIVQLFENLFSWHSAHSIRIHADPSDAICIRNKNKKKKVLIIETQQAETHKGLIKGNEKAHKKIFINFWPFLWMESRRAQAKIYSFCIPGLGYLLIGFLQVNMRATLHYDANLVAFSFASSQIEGGRFVDLRRSVWILENFMRISSQSTN